MGIFPSDHSRLRGDITLDDLQGSGGRQTAEQSHQMLISLQVIIILLVVAFIFGYGVRACISRRRL